MAAAGVGRVLASLPLLAALAIYLVPSLVDRYESSTGYKAPEYELPSHVLDLFRSYDLGGDDLLDPYEFHDFLHQV